LRHPGSLKRGNVASPPSIKNLEDLRRHESLHVLAVIEALTMLTIERPRHGLGKARIWLYVNTSTLAEVAALDHDTTVEALNYALARRDILDRPPREGLAWEYRVDARFVP
jgi:hypothetical protein